MVEPRTPGRPQPLPSPEPRLRPALRPLAAAITHLRAFRRAATVEEAEVALERLHAVRPVPALRALWAMGDAEGVRFQVELLESTLKGEVRAARKGGV